MARFSFPILLFAVALLAGCASGPGPRATASLADQPYRLDAGDQLRIVVYNQPELTNIYGVEQAGHISMPLIGDVPARDLTTAELEMRIEATLARRYLRDPDVTVEVSARRPFFVLGEVNDPGQFPHVPGLTVRAAVATAGGYTARASSRIVRLTRTTDGETYEARVGEGEPVLPGDTITAIERLF